MKLKTNTVLKSLKGEAFKDGADDLTVGIALSNILDYDKDKTGGKYKLFILAKKLMESKEIDIDAADLGILKKAVDSTEAYRSNILLGSLIEVLDGVKDKKDK